MVNKGFYTSSNSKTMFDHEMKSDSTACYHVLRSVTSSLRANRQILYSKMNRIYAVSFVDINFFPSVLSKYA